MFEISYADFVSYIIMAFSIGIIYEHIANKYDYNTGKLKRKDND